jgi:hypothetical protein
MAVNPISPESAAQALRYYPGVRQAHAKAGIQQKHLAILRRVCVNK